MPAATRDHRRLRRGRWFGGRGKAVHGILGGLVIGGIYNGMYLQGLSVQWEFIVTGLVLVAAVTVDALSRRGRA